MMDQAEKLRALVKKKEESQIPSSEKKTAKIISITSGKGGVGKTSLTVNMAAFLARQGKRVLIIDADLGLSNVEIMLGVTPSFTLRDLIKKNKSMEEIIIKGPFDIDFISGGNGFLEVTELSSVERDEILIKLKKLDDLYDIIFIDTGAGISQNVLSFLLIADKIIVITTSEPTALTDAYSVMKIMNERKEELDIGLIINRIKEIKEHRSASNILIKTSDKFLKKDVKNLGFIYEDVSVKNTIFKKTPFVIYYPDSKASKCIKQIINKLAIDDMEEKKGIFEKFKQWFVGAGE